ncbi:bloated tubules [Carabus blaptoides fortunei]
MKDRWNKAEFVPSGAPIGLAYSFKNARPSIIVSQEALKAYNDISLENTNGYASSYFLQSDNETMTSTADSETIKSTTSLIQSQPKTLKCLSWLSHVERALSCVSLAACLGNVVRLPASVILHGGVPFLVAYLILVLVLGLPLVFLELGIAQIVQQGVTKTWRAVPLFRGVGYIKLLANVIVCIYYPIYMGLALFYVIWLAKGPVPFPECAVARMTETGYQTVGISAYQCLNKTFLESPIHDSKWFGMYGGFLAVIWLIIMLCSFGKITAYMRSINVIFIPILICLVTLFVKSIFHELEYDSLKYLYENIDWTRLSSADVWYFAVIQLFLSTHLGFGNVVTCTGKNSNKADPFWTALVYVLFNALFGILSVVTCYILTAESIKIPNSDGALELYIFTVIYNNVLLYREKLQTWSVCLYFVIFLSGFISLLAVLYAILNAITVESKNRWRSKHMSVLLCLIFFTVGTFLNLVPNFQIVHILDHYVVGNLILVSTILEVTAFVCFYGCRNLYTDFEFILGSRLTVIWKYLWCLAPVLLTTVVIWALATLKLTGFNTEDPIWVYSTGWAIVVACLVVILIFGIYEVNAQVGYNFIQKFISALKASRKWGPVDPILRYSWIQFRSTSGNNDRDFTLKRRSTRDYTHSVKYRRNTTDNRYVSTTNMSDATVLPSMSSPSHKSDQNDNSINSGQSMRYPLEVVSITDTLERDAKPAELGSKTYYLESVSVGNSHGVPALYGEAVSNDTNSEGYGTISKEPYIIANTEFDHVCWRRVSHEETTEL